MQPTCGPSVNDNVMELLIMADAFKRASASHITAIIPYYGYARQDRKARGREPITAKLMADLLESAGIIFIPGLIFLLLSFEVNHKKEE